MYFTSDDTFSFLIKSVKIKQSEHENSVPVKEQ